MLESLTWSVLSGHKNGLPRQIKMEWRAEEVIRQRIEVIILGFESCRARLLLLRGRGVSGVQDSARTNYWIQPVSKSSTWSPKQNKITRLRLAPHVCTVSTVGQIKPHFHPFRSCHLPTWCHSFWYKARNSFPTHDSLSQQTQRLNFWSLLSSFTTLGSALPQQYFSHVTFLQEWQTKLN